jgi:hypothetical protein
VFWPFLVGDILSFAFWPYAYYDPFWAYGPDFVLASIFAPGHYGGPAYGYGRPHRFARSFQNRRVDREALAETNAAAMQSCSSLAPGITDLPAEQIRKTIHPTAELVATLDDLSVALSKADEIVRTSCPNEVPLTPVARLHAAEQRIDAMIQAVQIVRSPLERFDESLNEQQRQRFDAMSRRAHNGRALQAGGNLPSMCSRQAEGVINVPVEHLQQVVAPNAQQQDAFDELKKVSEDAANAVQASCPTQMAPTPTARLDAAKARLSAMVQAMEAVRPKLEQFYASLTDEQKARFNALGPPQNPGSQPQGQSSGLR